MSEPVNSRDEEQLRLLTIFHFVFAGFVGLGVVACAIQFGLGYFLIQRPEVFGPGEAPPAVFGWMMAGFAVLGIVMLLILMAVVFFTARSLAARKRYTFCMVVAALECGMPPFGTVLGICTIVVLLRDSVKRLFGRGTNANALM